MNLEKNVEKNKQPPTFRAGSQKRRENRYKAYSKSSATAPSRPPQHALPFLLLWLPLTLVAILGFILTHPAASQDSSLPPVPSPTNAASVFLAASSTSTQYPTTKSANLPTFSTKDFVSPTPKQPANALTFPPLPTSTPLVAPTHTPLRREILPNILNDIVKTYRDGLGPEAEFAILVHNLDTDDRYEVNSNELFDTGSVYKLFVMLTVLHDISQNKYSFDTEITLTPDIPPYTLDEDGGVLIVPVGESMSVEDLLFAMINHSNNTAALMLLGKIHTAHMSDFARNLGMTGSALTDSSNFRTTVADLDIYFTKLANKKLLGSPYDEKMIELLSKQQFRTKIPGLLPPTVQVADKVGDFPGVSNDAGLVFLPNGQRVVIAVLIRNTNVDGSREFISQLSLAVYNYFMQKP